MPITNYIYDPVTEALLMEQDGDGNTTVVYTQEPVKYGDVLAQHRIDPATGVGESYYYHTDALGSTRELTDSSGTVVNTYTYDAFGNTIASTGTVKNPFRFIGNVGYYFDEELDTYHIRARNYQPTTGRWTSEDPTGFEGGDANLYRYVGNSPLNAIDPAGLELMIGIGQPLVSLVRPMVPMPRLRILPGSWPPPAPPMYPQLPVCPIPNSGLRPNTEPRPQTPPQRQRGLAPLRNRGPWKNQRTQSDCSELELAAYKGLINTHCKDVSDPNITCDDWMSTTELARMAHKWADCEAARRLREDKCYRGGDPTHEYEIDMADYHQSNCWYYFRYWNDFWKPRCPPNPGIV